MKTKPYVRIQSQTTITVTCGLQHKDVTNPDAHVPDRLKVSSEWPSCSFKIKEGAHIYPSEIVEWNTVKALERDKIITIGEYLDSAEEDVVTAKEKLTLELNTHINKAEETSTKESKQLKLSDIAGE